MVSEEVILEIARVSASMASVFGIIILIMTVIAIRRFSPGQFRRAVVLSALFLLIAVSGVSAMTVYHLTEGAVYGYVNAATNNMWYALMFFALVFSCIESWKYGKLGESVSKISAKRKKK